MLQYLIDIAHPLLPQLPQLRQSYTRPDFPPNRFELVQGAIVHHHFETATVTRIEVPSPPIALQILDTTLPRILTADGQIYEIRWFIAENVGSFDPSQLPCYLETQF